MYHRCLENILKEYLFSPQIWHAFVLWFQTDRSLNYCKTSFLWAQFQWHLTNVQTKHCHVVFIFGTTEHWYVRSLLLLELMMKLARCLNFSGELWQHLRNRFYWDVSLATAEGSKKLLHTVWHSVCVYCNFLHHLSSWEDLVYPLQMFRAATASQCVCIIICTYSVFFLLLFPHFMMKWSIERTCG